MIVPRPFISVVMALFGGIAGAFFGENMINEGALSRVLFGSLGFVTGLGLWLRFAPEIKLRSWGAIGIAILFGLIFAQAHISQLIGKITDDSAEEDAADYVEMPAEEAMPADSMATPMEPSRPAWLIREEKERAKRLAPYTRPADPPTESGAPAGDAKDSDEY